MGRICKVCWSPHRPEYDEKIIQGWEIKEVWRRLAIAKYNEKFSYESMRKHAKNHVKALIRSSIEASKLRQKTIDEEIKKSIEVSTQLRRNLQLCNDQLEALKDLSNPDTRREIRDIIGKVNQTVELLLRFSDKITEHQSRVPTEEELMDRLRYSLQDIPWEYAGKILERFENYERIKEAKEISRVVS